jgi:glutamine cyclotransferase
MEQRLKQRIALLIIVALHLLPVPAGGKERGPAARSTSSGSIPVYGYELMNTFPHDPNAFTQGLIYHNGFLYEGTGLYGGSSLRKVVLETGEVLLRYNLASVYFGEGVTIRDGKIYQLTWLNHVGFVYVETDSFELVDSFGYTTPGWGLTHDDTSLIMSDGTDKLYHLDPETFEEVGRVYVTADGSPVPSINELELIRGRIYANILNSDSIAVIVPETGEVVAWLDLTGILPPEQVAQAPGPLNGIAFDPDGVRLFVTGKRWPSVFEIYSDPLDYPPEIVRSSPQSPVWVHLDTPVHLSVSAEDGGPMDSLTYMWSVNGMVDPSAHDSSYEYSSSVPAVDTVAVEVTDGVFSDSTSWLVYVEIAGIDDGIIAGEGRLGMMCLAQNRPNPFKPETMIDFVVPGMSEASHTVRLTIHDIHGRMVRKLVDGELAAGSHRVHWDAADDRGKRVCPGIFFCVLKVGEQQLSRKLVVIE